MTYRDIQPPKFKARNPHFHKHLNSLPEDHHQKKVTQELIDASNQCLFQYPKGSYGLIGKKNTVKSLLLAKNHDRPMARTSNFKKPRILINTGTDFMNKTEPNEVPENFSRKEGPVFSDVLSFDHHLVIDTSPKRVGKHFGFSSGTISCKDSFNFQDSTFRSRKEDKNLNSNSAHLIYDDVKSNATVNFNERSTRDIERNTGTTNKQQENFNNTSFHFVKHIKKEFKTANSPQTERRAKTNLLSKFIGISPRVKDIINLNNARKTIINDNDKKKAQNAINLTGSGNISFSLLKQLSVQSSILERERNHLSKNQYFENLKILQSNPHLNKFQNFEAARAQIAEKKPNPMFSELDQQNMVKRRPKSFTIKHLIDQINPKLNLQSFKKKLTFRNQQC